MKIWQLRMICISMIVNKTHDENLEKSAAMRRTRRHFVSEVYDKFRGENFTYTKKKTSEDMLCENLSEKLFEERKHVFSRNQPPKLTCVSRAATSGR